MPVFDDGSEMPRPAARHSISIRQPRPSIGCPPITQSIGMKTSLPGVGAVLEHRVERHVAAADLHARMRRRNERARDAEVFRVADELVGIVDAEREAEQRRDRAERDVALVPRHAQAQHALALVLAPADDAVVGNRRRVGAGVRIGEREARNLEPLGEARQVVAASARRCRSAARSSPGPSEFGTITVTATVPERVDSLVITCECANAEKPRPPYSFGMIMPRKPLSLMNCQTCGGRSL